MLWQLCVSVRCGQEGDGKSRSQTQRVYTNLEGAHSTKVPKVVHVDRAGNPPPKCTGPRAERRLEPVWVPLNKL